MYKHHHLLRKEEGFRAYFKDNSINKKIVKIDIKKADGLSIGKEITSALSGNKDISLIFVTNSRVSIVANCLKKLKRKLILIGYDFVEENIKALTEGDIDFLICQKPGEQGYKGVMSLYKYIVLDAQVERMQFMPIDIITRENCQFYTN